MRTTKSSLIRLDRFLPDVLSRPRIFGIPLFEWLTLFVVLPFCYRLLGAVNWLAWPFVAFWRRRSGGRAGPADVRVPGLVRLVLLGIGIRWVLGIVDLPLLERQFWTVIVALLLMVAFGWFLLLLNGYGEQYLRRRFATFGESASLVRVARRIVDVLIVVACGLTTFRYFGGDPTAALAGLGIGGIAVALAAQKTLENVIAGLSLIFDQAVRVGDFLKVGETVGTVDYIGLRSTRIRTVDRTMLSMPNGQIASVGIETLSARDKFRFNHIVGLRYGTTVGQMRAVIDGVRTLLLTHTGVESDSVRVRFFRLGSFSLDIEVVRTSLPPTGNVFSRRNRNCCSASWKRSTRRGRQSRFPRRPSTSQGAAVPDPRNEGGASWPVSRCRSETPCRRRRSSSDRTPVARPRPDSRRRRRSWR